MKLLVAVNTETRARITAQSTVFWEFIPRTKRYNKRGKKAYDDQRVGVGMLQFIKEYGLNI